jgi:NAD(P)-dependent dehydrogenase (short-subunit alcohol dehydrogenase family)
MDTKNRTALIVGASRGLGLGLAKELAARGFQVTATARDLDKAPGLRELPGSARLETLDIDDAAAVDELAKRLAGKRFDVIFINAGIMGPEDNSADTATMAEIGKLFATNAISPIRLARKLLGNLTPGKGVLGFMTSRMGSIEENTSGGMELYRASKSALNSMIKSLAVEIDGKDVTFIAMHPGWVKTDMGGASAPLDVATSVRGIADQLEKRAGKGGLAFIDYKGEELPW